MYETGLILMALATLASLALAAGLIPVARRLGWMDRPEARKVHAEATPLVGGLAVFGAGAVVVAAWDGSIWVPLLAGSAVVLLSGLIDDRWPQAAAFRFAAQILACLIMIFWGEVLLWDFGRLFRDDVLGLGPLAVPITVFAALGVINAVNMIDGMDGLCGTVFLVSALALAFLAGRAGRAEDVTLLLAVSGAVVGFLLLNARWPWNRRARIFLGDSGSTFLGFFLAWMCISLGNGADRAMAPMTAVWIVGVPLLDTTRLIRRRLRERQPVFGADQYHLHHAFLRAGFSTRQALAGVGGLCALSAGVGIALELWAVPEYWRFYAYIAFGLAYLRVMRNTWRRGRFLGRPIQPLPAGDAR